MVSVLFIDFFLLGVCSSHAYNPDVIASLGDNCRPEIRPDFADYGGAGFRYERKRYFDAVLIEPKGLGFFKIDAPVWVGFSESRFRRIELNAALTSALSPGASPRDSASDLHSPANAGLSGGVPISLGTSRSKLRGMIRYSNGTATS